MTTYTPGLPVRLILLCLLVCLPVTGVCGDAQFSWNGFVELENLYQLGQPDLPFDDADKKNELRTHLQITYGTDRLSLYLAPDLYLLSSGLINDGNEQNYFYKKEFTVGRNLKISDEHYEIAFDEFYLQYARDKYRVRIGNQIFGWGTTDVYNPTSYFNPLDMREALFKDDDEGKEGVFSLSSMVFLGRFTLETAVAPFHTSGLVPEESHYWQFKLDNYTLPVVFAEPEEKEITFSNVGVGMRVSTTAMNTDVSLSVFHGPDKDLLFLPTRTIIEDDYSVSVLVEPKSCRVTSFGLDFSKAFDDIVVQGEVAFSPDKAVRSEEEVPGAPSDPLLHEVLKVPYLSYSIGFNYFIPLYNLLENHEGDTVFTMEWFQNSFFEDEVSPPILTDLLICSFRDTYFESRYGLTLTAIADMKQKGYVIWPKVTYDFLNGWTTSLSYVDITGTSHAKNVTESLFYYYRDNDTLMWSIRYAF